MEPTNDTLALQTTKWCTKCIPIHISGGLIQFLIQVMSMHMQILYLW